MRALFILLSILFFGAGCGPREGERCNPLQFNNECDNGNACVYPPNCGVAFCCPSSGMSHNANCQACAPLDGGTD